ncbi:MAG: hypothetical protein JW741_19350 [Sedimentisphaerales bacterium]|nr:hypothetical protein [Sedimentisphaerales bacterium]
MKRILYVDRDLSYCGSVLFAQELRALGEVCLMELLSWDVTETVERAVSKDCPFDAVVSHLPQAEAPLRDQSMSHRGWAFDLKHAVYGPAFGMLGGIKEIADIPVMVYTGAAEIDIPAVPWELSGADDIVHKSHDPEKDGRRMVKAIRERWDKYAELPPATEVRCETDASSAWVETLVRLNWGVGMVAGTHMARILQGLEWLAERIDAQGVSAGCDVAKDIMGMLCLEAVCGSRLRIRVNDATPEAWDALCRAHRLLNGRYLRQAE